MLYAVSSLLDLSGSDLAEQLMVAQPIERKKDLTTTAKRSG